MMTSRCFVDKDYWGEGTRHAFAKFALSRLACQGIYQGMYFDRTKRNVVTDMMTQAFLKDKTRLGLKAKTRIQLQ